jgi:hypothetical protein
MTALLFYAEKIPLRALPAPPAMSRNGAEPAHVGWTRNLQPYALTISHIYL